MEMKILEKTQYDEVFGEYGKLGIHVDISWRGEAVEKGKKKIGFHNQLEKGVTHQRLLQKKLHK